jgi:hypothetical protein
MRTKLLFFILLCLPFIGIGQCVQIDSVYSTAEVKQLENRNVLFGIKAITEDLLQEKGYSLCAGELVTVNVNYIGLPENTFRIGGFAISNKITEIRVTVSIGSNMYSGSGKYKSQAKAMLLELDNGVPFQQTTLSTAIKMALTHAIMN